MLSSEGKGLRGKWSVIKLLALIGFFLNYSKAGSPMSVPSLRMEMENRSQYFFSRKGTVFPNALICVMCFYGIRELALDTNLA